jgi:hypothetical protein
MEAHNRPDLSFSTTLDIYSQRRNAPPVSRRLGTAYVCFKIILLLANLVFLIFACALIGLGSYALNSSANSIAGQTLPAGLVAMGVFILILSAIGAISAWKESVVGLGFVSTVWEIEHVPAADWTEALGNSLLIVGWCLVICFAILFCSVFGLLASDYHHFVLSRRCDRGAKGQSGGLHRRSMVPRAGGRQEWHPTGTGMLWTQILERQRRVALSCRGRHA